MEQELSISRYQKLMMDWGTDFQNRNQRRWILYRCNGHPRQRHSGLGVRTWNWLRRGAQSVKLTTQRIRHNAMIFVVNDLRRTSLDTLPNLGGISRDTSGSCEMTRRLNSSTVIYEVNRDRGFQDKLNCRQARKMFKQSHCLLRNSNRGALI